MLRLLKFKNWTTYNYNGVSAGNMAQVNLPPVGNGFHNIQMSFAGTRIAVYYDGVMVVSTNDAEFQTYPSGSISADMWTDTVPYVYTLDNAVVSPRLVASRAFGAATIVADAEAWEALMELQA